MSSHRCTANIAIDTRPLTVATPQLGRQWKDHPLPAAARCAALIAYALDSIELRRTAEVGSEIVVCVGVCPSVDFRYSREEVFTVGDSCRMGVVEGICWLLPSFRASPRTPSLIDKGQAA